jgi:hypothetical protein
MAGSRKSPSIARAIKLRFGQAAYEAYKATGAIPPGYGSPKGKVPGAAPAPAPKGTPPQAVPAPKPPPSPFDKIKDQIASMHVPGQPPKPKQLVDVGSSIREAVHDTNPSIARANAMIRDADLDVQRLSSELDDIRGERNGRTYDPVEAKRLQDEVRTSRAELVRLKRDLVLQIGQAYLDGLSEIRPMGIEKLAAQPVIDDDPFGGGSPRLTNAVKRVTRFFPADWNRRAPAIRVRRTMRGEISNYNGGNIALETTKESIAAHELAHAMEHIRGFGSPVLKAQADYFHSRTWDEPIKTAFNGGESYQYKRDKWADPYVGRIYPHGGWEILSMGIEGTFFGKYNIPSRDQELVDWTLGVLASVGWINTPSPSAAPSTAEPSRPAEPAVA